MRVHIKVNAGLDLSLKKLSRHQRMPSHEALLKVARRHRLPLPLPPPPPTDAGSAATSHTSTPSARELAAGSVPELPSSRFQHASGVPSGLTHLMQHPSSKAFLDPEAVGRQRAAEVVYGERWGKEEGVVCVWW